MPDVYTTTATVNSVQTAYDRRAYFQLRKDFVFADAADVQPTAQSMPGSAVKFTIYNEFSPATTALNESVDVDAVAAADAQVTVTLVEQGNAAVTTAKLRGTSFLGVQQDVSNLVNFNMLDSFESIVAAKLVSGSNVRYATGGTTDPTARNTVQPEDTLSGADVMRARSELVGAAAMPFAGNLYRAYIHPDVSYDFRQATGGANWRDPHTYSQPAEIWSGEIGAFEGFRFIESARVPVFSDAGSSTTLTDVYATIFLGQQALAMAYSSSVSAARPQVVIGPITDKLRRFQPIGWYWLGGFGIFRQAALRRVESSSSIGVNA